jgi:hypothetical protein
MAPRKKNYLNNRDLLKEIHKSKNSYCSYLNEEDSQYDIILPSVEKINRNTISQAKKNRADRIAKEKYEAAIESGERVKQDHFAFDHKTINKTELVFRVISWEHIPEEPGRKKNPKNIQDHYVKLNFPPFQHYKLDENDEPYCVGKSHWVGGLENGYFSLDHGTMTNKLAKMFMMMCERYGNKWNWRGYTYNDEMKSQALLQLAQVGLQFDESKSQNPFAYYTATITNSFTRILNTEKKNQNIRDDMLEMNGYNSSHSRQLDAHMKWKEDTGQL